MEYTHFVRAGIVMAAYDEARQNDQNTALLSDDILLGMCVSLLPDFPRMRQCSGQYVFS